MVQATFNVSYEGLDFTDPRVIRALAQLRAQTIHAARFDLRNLMLRRLRRAIRETTQRRTGTLARSPRVRVRQVGRRGNFDLVPNFPRTAFSSQPGYGRHGGRGVGQYAFVVDHNQFRRGGVGFITLAIDGLITDPEFAAIVQRHFVQQVQRVLALYGRDQAT